MVVSDSHLSERAPEAEANWSAAARYVPESGANLVIHAGDLSLDGAHHGDDLARSRRWLEQLPVPWLVVPGNHDVGDNPGPAAGTHVSEDRLDRWRRAIGPDHWYREVGPWMLIGVNAQLFGSELPAESEQWRWLTDVLGDQRERPILLVSHKPLTSSDHELATSPGYRFIPQPDRRRLEAILSGRSVPLVLSGHVHQHRVLTGLGAEQRRHVWAPTTWAVLPEHAQATVGLKRCGVLVVVLGESGVSEVRMVEPEGIAQLTLTTDIADPYGHE